MKTFNFALLTVLTMATGMVLGTSAAYAQQGNNCAPRAMVLERLTTNYGETRQTVGLAANNSVVEMFANIETGSWTFTVTLPNGMTCLAASGQAYENLSEALAPQGDEL